MFPAWTDKLFRRVLVFSPLIFAYVVACAMYATSPETTHVGYEPEQPVPFSHKTHAGQLKMDCRYCHNTVEEAAHAAVPPTQTCINCHSPASADGTVELTAVHAASENLTKIHESFATGKSVEWNRVHDLPDYVYFNHAAHVSAGVGCISCHGRIDEMEVVSQVKTMSMQWCLECHRNPEPHLRSQDKITAMDFAPTPDISDLESLLKDHTEVAANQNCSTCHR